MHACVVKIDRRKQKAIISRGTPNTLYYNTGVFMCLNGFIIPNAQTVMISSLPCVVRIPECNAHIC